MLAIALIIMIAVKWSNEPNFTEYIGNVATFSSLILGVIAIFYSFTSNNSLSSSLGNIANASESLRNSEIEIKTVLDQSKLLTSNHGENIQKMHEISESVQVNVSMLTEALKDISEKTTELQSTVLTVPTRLDAISEKLDGQSKAVPTPLSNRQGMSPDEALYFHRVASVSGNLITYGCVLAKAHDKEISAIAFNKLLDRSFSNLTIGFMDCMAAADIIRRKSIKGKPGYWKIVEVDKEIEGSVKSYILDWISRAYANEPEKHAEYTNLITRMEKAFESEGLPVID